MPARINADTLAKIRSYADRGDDMAQALMGIMNNTFWTDTTVAAEASNVIGVTCQIKDQDGSTVTGVKAVRARLVPPIKAAKTDVRLATAAALPACTAAGSGVGKTLTGNANAALTIDGVAVVNGDRVLVKNQVTGANNGIYTQTTLGDGSTAFVLTRATDFDASSEMVHGARVFVVGGTVNAGKTYLHTTSGTITVETTALTFADRDAATTAGALSIGASGTLVGGADTFLAFIQTNSSGAFVLNVSSVLVGDHLLELVTDNGETELVTLTFA